MIINGEALGIGPADDQFVLDTLVSLGRYVSPGIEVAYEVMNHEFITKPELVGRAPQHYHGTDALLDAKTEEPLLVRGGQVKMPGCRGQPRRLLLPTPALSRFTAAYNVFYLELIANALDEDDLQAIDIVRLGYRGLAGDLDLSATTPRQVREQTGLHSHTATYLALGGFALRRRILLRVGADRKIKVREYRTQLKGHEG